MGTAYFADKIQRVRRRCHLALASYNAGETAGAPLAGRAAGPADRDEFIDDIPYPETQNYVKRILGTAEDYRRLYGGSSTVADASRSRSGALASQPKSDHEVDAGMSKLTGSKKATQFTESVIREMTRLNQLHGGVNLSQGFPGLSGAATSSRTRRARRSAPTSTSTPSPGARGRCARRSRASSRAATACRSSPTSRSPSAAARPKR